MGLRSNWLHRSIVLFAYTAGMVLSDDRTVIGDYPPGCYGGSGFIKTRRLEALDGACLYMTGEVNSQGVKPRFIGFRLESNLPGSDKGEYGTFELQWALPEGGANSQAVNVSGTGQVQLSVGTDEVFMRLALGSPYITTTEDGVTAVNISCHVLAYFNEAIPWTANVATPWYYTGGRANTFAIALHSPVVESRAEAFNGNFYTTQLHISILQARGNSYQLAASFWAEGAYVPWGERELRPFGIYTDIVTGYVYY